MKHNSPTRKRDVFLRKSESLKAEIDGLVSSLYGIEGKDTKLRYENLKTYRAEIQRSFVLYMQLAIENLLRALLFDFLTKHNIALSKKELKKTVDDMKSADLIHWCSRLRTITQKRYTQLLELNRIRNACVHNWILDAPKYKKLAGGRQPKRIRLPVVTYKGRNLLDREVFLEDFCPTYGRMYVQLLGTVWRKQGKI